MIHTNASAPCIVLIAAVAANGVIGVDNTLPWRIADDLKRFKALTLGHPIIMGRKTWESLGRALPGRHNIVITRNPDYCAEGASVVTSLTAAIATCAHEETAFVIGGAEIYAQTLPLAQRMELTEIHAEVVGDAHFPEFSHVDWSELTREPHASPDGLTYDFVSYQRKKAGES
jgi:dihydrofolate reductase